VIITHVEVDVSRLERVPHRALRPVEFGRRRQRTGRAQLFTAGGVFDQLAERFDRARGVEVAADLGRARAADLGAAVALQVFDEVGELEFAHRFLTGGDFARLALFASLLLEHRLDEVEGGRVDFVLGSFVSHVGLVAEQCEAPFPVQVFAAERALGRKGEVEFGVLGFAFALEWPGEAGVDPAAFLTLHVDVDRQVHLAAFDSLESRFLNDRLRVIAAAAAAGGECCTQRNQRDENGKNANSVQSVGLLDETIGLA
jgi:hypothetical protein